PKSAMDLFEGLRPLRRSRAMYVTASVAAFAGVAFAAMLVSSGIHRFREHSAGAALASGDARRIEPLLGELATLKPARRGALLLHDDARAGLIKYFEERINALVDASKGRYDYRRASTSALMRSSKYLI